MSDRKPLISVVLPSYNDAQLIEPFYGAIVNCLGGQERYDWELVYVDDGSRDNSVEVLERLAARDSRVTVVVFERNFGQQRALFAGLQRSRGDFAVLLDGDFQYEPRAILDLVDAMTPEHEMASGVRRDRKDDFWTVQASKIGNKLISRHLSSPLKDFGSVKALSRPLIDAVIEQSHTCADVHPTAFAMRPKTIQVEVVHLPRTTGRSGWGFWKRVKLFFDFYILVNTNHFSPMFSTGAALSALAVAFPPAQWLYARLSGAETDLLLGVAIALLLAISGAGLIAWSLAMSLMIKIYKQNTRMPPFRVRQVVSHRKD
jgi:undecaprenyl-phosphate 4-deoxy-4-formamido-L-arabinose transferase